MAQMSRVGLPKLWRKLSVSFLAFFWISGLAAGCLAVSLAGDSLLSLMRGAAKGSVSIVGMLCVTVFPFLFSAYAVYVSKSWLLLPVCFGKAFEFSFVSLLAMLAYSDAGWLVRLLLCFGSCCTTPLLYTYWLRHISGERPFSWRELALFLFGGVLIGSIDYCIVSPFLMALIN